MFTSLSLDGINDPMIMHNGIPAMSESKVHCYSSVLLILKCLQAHDWWSTAGGIYVSALLF